MQLIDHFSSQLSSSILVHFHIGRGGRFYNQGHKTFLGTANNLSDFFGKGFLYSEDDDGNALPDKDWKLLDGAGNIILEGREAIESPVGVLDWDGDYDTDIVRYLSECSDEEYQLIIDAYNNNEYVDDDIIAYACQATDQLLLRKIQFTEDGGMDVQTQNKTIHFTRDDFSNVNEAKELLLDVGFIEDSVESISRAMDNEFWF